MARKYPGVYTVRGKKGIKFGIDYAHPDTGYRVRKILRGVKTAREAFDLRSIELADAERGATNKAYEIKTRGRPLLFVDMIEEYLKWARENKRSWKTDRYRGGHLKKAFAGKLMSDVTAFSIERYKRERVKEVKKSTVNKELILGAEVYGKATDWKKWHGANPFFVATKFKLMKAKKPGYLSVEQVSHIMAAIPHPVKRDMVEFAFNTGWRIGEIRRLKWRDVDSGKGTAWIIDPKNANSVEIDLNDEALEVLRRQPHRSEHVFCHLNGRPYKTNLHGIIKGAAKRAHVYLPPRKAWHILRRTWASMMLQTGCDIETLRVLGNWRDIQMPLWYADAADQVHRKKVLNSLPKVKVEEGNKIFTAEKRQKIKTAGR